MSNSIYMTETQTEHWIFSESQQKARCSIDNLISVTEKGYFWNYTNLRKTKESLNENVSHRQLNRDSDSLELNVFEILLHSMNASCINRASLIRLYTAMKKVLPASRAHSNRQWMEKVLINFKICSPKAINSIASDTHVRADELFAARAFSLWSEIELCSFSSASNQRRARGIATAKNRDWIFNLRAVKDEKKTFPRSSLCFFEYFTEQFFLFFIHHVNYLQRFALRSLLVFMCFQNRYPF